MEFSQKSTIFARRTKRKSIMTAITINIPNHEVSFFKKMMEKMGWTYSVAEPRKPRLYDPETGEYLNDETMKVIENAHKGIGVTHYDSVDEMFRSILGEEEFKKIRSSNV